ncbi:hypothetical protein MNB_SV-3-1569 [hydrothermal vent metagenome]|uniref:YbjN domain-containing protein n=1 Tax=hydrothermal vent metagenome TaxID=652676 RepID=A0A1W1C936_9ZZZZ
MKIRIISMLTAIFLFAPIYLFAESTLMNKYSDSKLIQIMKDEGYSAVKSLKKGVVRIKIEGRTYLLFNKSDGDLQAYYAIGDVKLSYEDINQWNKNKRLSRAYLDSDKDPVLESDLLSNGGLNEKHITEFFRIFKISVKDFRKFVLEHDKS